MHQLRDYQKEIIVEIEAAIAQGYRRIMLQLPTGAGKTRCFVELAKRHRAKPYVGNIPNCLIVAHHQELIDQAVDALALEMGSKREIGVIKSKVEANPHRAIQVASIQSLIRRDFPRASLVIIDEAHHAKASSYQTVIRHYGEAIILGVTATPARTDKKGFKDIFQILIKGPTVKKLTAQKYLCPYKLYAYTRQKINTSSVRTQAGDYLLNDLADAVMDSQVRADLVKTWEKHARNKRTVVFAVSVELSKEYAATYKASGYKAEHIDGKTPEYERKAILNRFRRGETKILCNCNIVTEGFDLPEMECVQVVRPTQSTIFWLQMVGRSLRITQGKSHAIILDHTDNYQRLGLPDSDRKWTLSGVETVGFIKYFSGIGNNEHERRRRELQHIEGELVEIYSNSQELENNDMVKIRIDNVEYEATRSLADVISKKLDRLDEVEDLLTQKEDDVVDCQVSIYNLEIELNEKHKEIVNHEQVLQEIEAQSNNYKIKLETALEKIIDITRNQHSTQKLTEELDKLHQELTEKQNLLDIEISRANTTEKALKSSNNSLNKLRETYKTREIDFNDTTEELANKQKLLNELEHQVIELEEKINNYQITIKGMKENLDEILREEIGSRLHTFIRASKLLEAYNITFEDVGITADINAITAMKRVITKLNPKIDISDRSDEYVINKFDSYCEIVAKRIEYEKNISK